MTLCRQLTGIFTASLFLMGCAPQQHVQGSYSTPNKRVAGAVVGVTGATVLTGVSGGATIPAVGGAGILTGHVLSRHSLMQNLRQQGVQVVARGDTLRIILPADEIFEDGGVELNPARYRTLDYVASLLKEYGDTPVWVAGYSDDIGSQKQARVLTLQQARSVVTYLWVHGIAFNHLYASGHGRRKPIARNDASLGSAFNRRIEITLRDHC
jgi:outer membrane protein OmpA-like peptidoglycan-associated protein